MRRIFSKKNLRQNSTILGTVAGAVGSVLVNQPNPWAFIAGQILIAVGAGAVAHDSDAPR